APAPVPAIAPVHCQVPCGIYSDKLRVAMMREDCATIEKAMTQLATTPEAALDRQQMVRWVTTKDDHASKIQALVADYWLAQRIKLPAEDADAAALAKYHQQLSLLHRITVEAMKCKQTLDAGHVKALLAALDAFNATYFSAEDLKHLEDHHD
ncbi:MAG: superoxide dismutase [Ni], partial [Planctomycetota bacterium]